MCIMNDEQWITQWVVVINMHKVKKNWHMHQNMRNRDKICCHGPIACDYNVFHGLTSCSSTATAKSSTRPPTPLKFVSNRLIITFFILIWRKNPKNLKSTLFPPYQVVQPMVGYGLQGSTVPVGGGSLAGLPYNPRGETGGISCGSGWFGGFGAAEDSIKTRLQCTICFNFSVHFNQNFDLYLTLQRTVYPCTTGAGCI